MSKRFKLPKEFAEKWIKALKSGEYRQCRGTMYDSSVDGYCCLGVALSMNGVPNKKMQGRDVIVDENTGVFEKSTKNAPRELYGPASDNDFISKLTVMNDHDLCSFKDIADWIKENVEMY